MYYLTPFNKQITKMCEKVLRHLRPCSMDFYLEATKIYKLTS
jgi:hypothetical protein